MVIINKSYFRRRKCPLSTGQIPLLSDKKLPVGEYMRTASEIIARRKALWQEHKSIERDRDFTEAVAKELLANEALRAEIKREPRLLIQMVFVIVDKDKQTVPFFLNDVQREFSNDLYASEDDLRHGKLLNLKFLVLKGRQQGFTAYITAEQLARALIQRNFSGFTIADKSDNTQTIFEDKAKFPYNHLPEVLKPTEKYNNRKELHFEKLNARWRIATASKDIGRSKTVNFMHISEAAFLEVLISDVQAAIGEALTKDAVQIFESTANGYNEFKDAWDSGKFINKFYAWWRTGEYRQRFESQAKEQWFREQVNDTHSKSDWIWQRCKWLAEKMDWQQVYWYYCKWDNYINKDKIKQEYPCSPDEAFLASGRCVFDAEIVIHRKEKLREAYTKQPPKRGYFAFSWDDPSTQGCILNDSISFIESSTGSVTIYEDVQTDYPYVLGGDTKGEGRDKYAGTVINNVTGQRSATLHMQSTNSKPYTHQMYCLGRHYNNALIGIEINFNTAPIEELERLHYPKQYVRQQYDSFTKDFQKKFGWKTDGNTRPLIIDKEIELIEQHIELFNDITMLDECLTFIYDDNGRPDAESGKHDDLLFSDMIANEIRPQQRFTVDNHQTIDLSKLPEDLQDDYYNAPDDVKPYLAKKWGLVK